MPHTYTVEFRLAGPSLDLRAVNDALGLTAAYVRHAGSHVGRKKYRESVWAYNGYEDVRTAEWPDLERGLTFVLDRLWPRQDLLRNFKETSVQYWWCGHFQRSFDGGPRLSATLLSRLGEFGADLCIDNYFSADENLQSDTPVAAVE